MLELPEWWRPLLWSAAAGWVGYVVASTSYPYLYPLPVETPEQVLATARTYVKDNGRALGTSVSALTKLGEFGADLSIFDRLVHEPARYSSCDAPPRWYRVAQPHEGGRDFLVEAFVPGACATCWDVIRVHGFVAMNTGRVAKLWVERKPVWPARLHDGRACGPASESSNSVDSAKGR